MLWKQVIEPEEAEPYLPERNLTTPNMFERYASSFATTSADEDTRSHRTVADVRWIGNQ